MRWILGICAVAVMIAMIATVAVPAQTITPDVAILKLLPPETTGVAFVDVAGLQNAPLFQQTIVPKIGNELSSGPMSGFSTATGFQPARDVQRVTVGRTGAQSFVAIIEANFDSFKVQQYMTDKNVPSETYLGRVIYEPASPNSDNATGLTMINNLIIVGKIPSVKEAVDRTAAAAASVVDNADLMSQIRTIQTGNQVWAAGKFDINGLPKVPAQVSQVASSLTAGTYQMRVDQDLHLKASGTFTTADMAKATADLANGFVTVAKLQFANQQDMMQLINGFQASNSGTTLNVSLDASGAALKQIQANGMLKHGTGK